MTECRRCGTETSRRTLKDLSPSSKLIYKVLEHEGELTQQEIIDETRLSPRTTRGGIKPLQDHDLIDSRTYLPDARQSIYYIVGDPDD
ncbi:MarR family transcriptional regulator [Natronococcus sp. JC468]|nr:MarR family transcriptional regulator [Natronococcus sp. JC468]